MSSGDQAAEFVYIVVILVLVASAFAARRVPMKQSLKMLAGWLIIFLVAITAIAFLNDIGAFAESNGGRAGAVTAGSSETLRIRQSEDGHFWADAELNGTPVRFLIDSGASMTSISADTARRVGIEPSRGFPVLVDTAGGTVSARRGRVERMEIGSIERQDVPVHIFEGAGDMNVLGMNFLSSLSGWGAEGAWLVLKP